MSYSQYHQYYLQSMGIELYVERGAQQSSQAPSGTSKTTQSNPKASVDSATLKQQLKDAQKPAQTESPEKLSGPDSHSELAPIVELADMLADPLVADLLRVFELTPTAITKVNVNQFGFGRFIWRFDGQHRPPEFKQGKLTTGPLAQLRDNIQKKALWQCITEMMSQQHNEHN